MAQVAIIGAGVAGLHLGLFLQRYGVDTRLYAEQTPDQQRAARLPNTAAHFPHTRVRERALDVDHWDTPDRVATHINISVGRQLTFRGQMAAPYQVLDQRMYLARLWEDYLARGGQTEFGLVAPDAVAALAEAHDLIVVATGRGGLGDLFPTRPEHSPLTRPARVLCSGFYRGVAFHDGMNAKIHLVPGQGELFELAINSFDGVQHVLFFEAVPGSALEGAVRANYAEDPRRFEQTVLEALRTYFPDAYGRVTPADFGLTRPLDLLQGAIVPRVRQGYTQLPNGHWIVALGDAHIVNDPVAGQGANTASYSASVLGQAVLEDLAFDERFCRRVEQRIWDYAQDVVAWSNAVLFPPADHVLGLFMAAAQYQAVADVVVNNFNQPQRAWDILSSPQRTARLLRQYTGARRDPELAAA